ETRRLADDLANLLEARFVLARYLDDDVLISGGDRSLPQAQRVDTPQNDIFRLGNGALANSALSSLPNGEGVVAIVLAHGLDVRLEELAEASVDLGRVRPILQHEP